MPYHPGELAVQERAGVRSGAAKIAAGIDGIVEPAPAHFLAQRYTLYVGSIDDHGRPWASQLAGPPGFVTADGPSIARIDATPAPGDPLLANLRANPAVGLLAIDLTTRRRFRVNGTVRSLTDGVIEVAVAQAFGNCPKYIQRREPVAVSESRPDPSRVLRSATLSDTQRARIAAADTFFLATAHPSAGADVSHRGGRPGFVRTPTSTRIVWPDYQGNTMFNSLGNIAIHPRAGLLFVDFASGDVLQLTGHAAIDWDAEHAAGFAGAQRLVSVEIESAVEAPGRSPLRWRLLEPSPANP